MPIQQIVQSRYFRVSAIILGVLLVALLSFGVGVKVGMRKALFSARWGENFEHSFLGDRPGKGGRDFPGMMKMMDKGMRSGHGVAGDILSIADNTLILKDRNNQENTVRIESNTIINRGKNTIGLQDLKVGDKIAVIGKPQDDGVIAANLIRVFDDSNQ